MREPIGPLWRYCERYILLIEYEAVMAPEHLRAARLTTGDIGALLDAVAAVAERVELAFLWRPAPPDADDDMVLETAINGRADAIVTLQPARFCVGWQAL